MNDDGALDKWRDDVRSSITASMNAEPDVWQVDASNASEDGCGGGGDDDDDDDSGASSGTQVASISPAPSPTPVCW